MTKMNDALHITSIYAKKAAAACFGYNMIAPIPCWDALTLTPITKKMFDEIMEIYGYSAIGGVTKFFGVIIGAASCAKLATGIENIAPFMGTANNSIATYSLHMVTGIALIIALDMLSDGIISEAYIQNPPAGFTIALIGAATNSVDNIANGSDSVTATLEAKSALRARYIL